jgi:hypothetical protein
MIDANTLMMRAQSSRGELIQKLYFNNEFCIMVRPLICFNGKMGLSGKIVKWILVLHHGQTPDWFS